MARAKMIKEVEVKFSPAFEKAINGVKTTKKVKAKTKTAKPKTKKVTAKAPTKTKTKTRVATPKAAGPKVPRGYNIEKIEREMTIEGKKAMYELWEVTGKKMPQAKTFIGYDWALKYIANLEGETVVNKAFETAIKRATTKSERKELQAAKELNELAGDGKPVIEKVWANYFDGPTIDVDEPVKNTEDIDA